LAAGEFDAVSGVFDGVGQVQVGPGGGALLEGGVAERGAQVIHHGGKVEDPQTDGLVGAAGALEGGGNVRLVEPVEEHGQVGEHPAQTGQVAGPVEAIEGGVEQCQGLPEIAVHCFERGGF
jgi:hypothetical protein